MIVYNDENCKRLANHIVESMDVEALIFFVTTALTERYQENEENFREAVEHYTVQEEDLCDSI